MPNTDNPLGSAAGADAPQTQDITKIRRTLQEEGETQTNVAIKDSLREKIRHQAYVEERTMKEIINEAIAFYYLNRE
jgi:hypothetical protein